jgi:hypothetical protein
MADARHSRDEASGYAMYLSKQINSPDAATWVLGGTLI